MFKNVINCLIICFVLISTGCAGRAANPVSVVQPGDSEKSCDAIKHELAFVESEIKRLIPDSEKTGENVALGVAGVFLIVPWFFMDFSESEKIEINALRQRYNYLAIVYNDKKCGDAIEPIPEFKTEEKASE